MLKKILQNTLLIVLGITLGLGVAEGSLRVLRPDLKTLVHPESTRHRFRIHAHQPNLRHARKHPDTFQEHPVIYNTLGLRQHREFLPTKPDATIRIGIFGDSFTENSYLPVEFSFTEPLDYLLNRMGKRFEVLNFGNGGYSLDQSYLQYLDEGILLDLDMVVYVYCDNDLVDLLANRLFDIDMEGKLTYLPGRPQSFFIRTVRNFYLTYFLMERFAGNAMQGFPDLSSDFLYESDKMLTEEGEERNRKKYTEFHTNEFYGQQPYPNAHHLGFQKDMDPDLRKSLTIFSEILLKMQNETQNRSQMFLTVGLPLHKNRSKNIQRLVQDLHIDFLSLYPIFEKESGEVGLYEYARSRFHFKNNGHWNEEGNQLAAIYLSKHIASVYGMPHDDEFIRRSLTEYYQAFDDAPLSLKWLDSDAPVNPQTTEEIHSKYLALN